MQLEKIDVATRHIRSKDLNEQVIISAIEEMKQTYDIKKRNAESISEIIQAENGLNEAVRLIGNMI